MTCDNIFNFSTKDIQEMVEKFPFNNLKVLMENDKLIFLMKKVIDENKGN